MPNPNNHVCELNDIIKQKILGKVETTKGNLYDRLIDIKSTVSQKKDDIKNRVNTTVANINVKKNETVSNLIQKYEQTSIPAMRSARPDVTLFIEISVLVGILIMLYIIWPYLSADKSHIFSKEQYLKAAELPESAYSISELSKIRVELESLKKYFEFFNSPPYSPENQGINDLNRGVIFLPIISFLVIYIVPPFVILYIIWFIVTYWKYVIAAVWAWFLMMWNFTSKLIECKLASKWYVRLVTGWTECSPNFTDYFNAWRRQYVDIPVYYEKLKYVQEYYEVKNRYYTIPKRYYIDLPSSRSKIKIEYLRKVYVNRAADVFLKKLLDWYGVYYELPRDELYRYLLRNNKNLAAIWSKVNQTKKQVMGLPYESATVSGSKCTCPSTQTPAKIIKNLAKDDIKTAADKVKKLYDMINESRDKTSEKINVKPCEAVNVIVSNRNRIYFVALFSVILFFVILYCYSQIFGTPKWWYAIISQTWKFKTGLNLEQVLQSKMWDYSVYFVIGLIFTMSGYFLYRFRGV